MSHSYFRVVRAFCPVMTCGAVLAVLLGTAEVALCQGWQTYQGNAAHDGYVPCQIDPLRLSVTWTCNAASSGRIATDGRTVIKGNGTTLSALDAFSGSTLWSISGDFSEPAISDGIAYVTTSTQGMSGLFNWFNAYSIADGSLIFTTHLDTQWDTYFTDCRTRRGLHWQWEIRRHLRVRQGHRVAVVRLPQRLRVRRR